jgi:predicted CoA-binding protein
MNLENKKTLVLGASLKSNKYSHIAIQRLVEKNIDVVAIGLKRGVVSGVEIQTKKITLKNIHTVTLYLNAKRQQEYYDYIISLKPKRVIFNPGTENEEFYKILEENKINYEIACTLVLLRMNLY